MLAPKSKFTANQKIRVNGVVLSQSKSHINKLSGVLSPSCAKERKKEKIDELHFRMGDIRTRANFTVSIVKRGHYEQAEISYEAVRMVLDEVSR